VSAAPAPNGIPDFEEDLRLVGLGTKAMLPAAAAAEGRGETGTNAIMARWVKAEVLEAVRLLYLRHPDGTAGPDSVGIRFYLEGDPDAPQLEAFAEQLLEGGETAKSFSAISIGGGDLGLPYTGLAQAGDLWNRRNEANLGPHYGAFSTKVLALFFAMIESDPAIKGVFTMIFGPFIPELGQGGVAVGEDPLDAQILGAGFDPAAASPAARQRYQSMVLMVDMLRLMIGVLVAHEIGHGLGLVADGPPPRGLFGGEKNAAFVGADRTNHHHIDTAGFNVMAAGPGSVAGGSLDPMQYLTTPAFNPLNMAYLQGRILVLP